MLRYWDGVVWTEHQAPQVAASHPYPATQPHPAMPAVPEPQRIEPWALVISLLPLIGIVGGIISMVKGKTLTGGLMILVGVSSMFALQLLRLV
jgi:Protein of unknown function (DUF2510)